MGFIFFLNEENKAQKYKKYLCEQSSIIKLGILVNAIVTTFSWPKQDHCDFKVNSGYIGRTYLYLKINNKITTDILLMHSSIPNCRSLF